MTRITIRFGDTDPAGFVYYPVLFHYLHVAMEEFFAAMCDVSYARLIADERIGFPVVKSEAEFFTPLFYGDEAKIEVGVVQVGRSSVTLRYEVGRVADGSNILHAEQVHVAINLDSRRAVLIPEFLRESLMKEGKRNKVKRQTP
jgi:4-hydroxybenzoyl-CoA thioesterase